MEKIEQELRDALNHLYDPDYQPPNTLYEFMGCDPQDGVLAVQSAIVQAIERLAPESDTPPTSLARQVYDLLYNRFVLKLTLEETAERMHTSFSSTWRTQRSAVHTLARTLWEQRRSQEQADETSYDEKAEAPPDEEARDAQADNWQSQMQREMASLQERDPGTVSDVPATVTSVSRLMNGLIATYDAQIDVQYAQPGLMANIHPSLLRQVLIASIRLLAQHSTSGQIAVYASSEGGNVRITLTSAVAGLEDNDHVKALLEDAMTPKDVSIDVHLDGPHAFLWLDIPSIGKINVMAVDDNPDMIRFYRRAVLGTRYHIVEVTRGRDVAAAIEDTGPDIILLDVMLPDMDGWQVLMQLHEDPATRSIPVIVCTVVREQELALSLGASAYLSKPVSRSQLIQALDQALPQPGPKAATSPTST